MPKPKARLRLLVNTIFESLINTTHSMMGKDSENPRTNSSTLFNQLYSALDHFDDEFCWSAYTDWNILLLISKYRYSNREDATRSGRLCIDFTLTNEHLGIPRDIASFALYFKHHKTLHCLLQEELLTWNTEEEIKKGLDRTLGPNNFTWFHKSMILASLVHEAYKDTPSDQLELTEFLQNSMQLYVDLLGKYTTKERYQILSDIAVLFAKMHQDKVISLVPLVFPMLLLKDLLEERVYQQFLTAWNFNKEKEIGEIIETYGLDPASLIIRKEKLSQMKTDLNQGGSEPSIGYLKTRFRLSFMMFDNLLFQECIGNASVLNMEALIESIYDGLNIFSCHIIGYFLENLPKEIKRKTLDYLFLKHSKKYISSYMSSSELTETNEVHLMMKSLLRTFSSLGTTTEQYEYLQALIKTGISNKLPDLINTLIMFLRQLQSPLSTMDKIFELKEDKVKHGIPDGMIKYPLLMDILPGKYNQFHLNIMESIETAEANSINEKTTWIVYFSFMHIALFFSGAPTYESEWLLTAEMTFQALEYWFDQLLENKSKYPSLWNRMQGHLLETNFFSDPKLKYLFNHRFGEFTDARLKLEKAFLTSGHGPSDKILKSQYGKNLALLMSSSVKEPLIKDLSTTFQGKEGSINEQLIFVQAWVLWAESLEEKLGIEADKYKTTKSTRLMLDALINQTPIIKELSKISGKISSPSLFLDALMPDEKRINYIQFAESMVFDFYSSELFFVILLFINRSSHPVIYNFMATLLYWINYVCEFDPSKKIQYEPFYEVMAKNNFFQQKLNYLLIKIFYINNLVEFPSLEEGPTIPALDSEEMPLSEKKPKRKKKKRAGSRGEGAPEQTQEQGAPEESCDMPANILLQSIKLEDVEPPPSNRLAISPEATLVSDLEESVDTSSDEGCSDEVKDSEETIAKKILLRKAQQELLLRFKHLIVWSNVKIKHLGSESIQAIQYNKLIQKLEINQTLLRAIRNLVKHSMGPSLGLEFEASSFSAIDYLQKCNLLLDQMKECSADIKEAEEIRLLIEQIKPSSPDELIQLQLLEQVILPEMPIVNKIVALFSKHANIFISGTSLLLPNPMDIDLCFEIKDDTLSIEAATDLFKSILKSSDLKFKIVSSKLLIGIASITIEGKGDGYNLENHKPIDFNLQLADPSKRLATIKPTSHSGAKLNLITGSIDCTPETADAIIHGIFRIYPVVMTDPNDYNLINVHIWTTMMRVWAESKLRSIYLDEESVFGLITQIKDYKGDKVRFEQEQPYLNKALIGMIIRHFKHFACNNTFIYRTIMLMDFLTYLNMHELITSGIAPALQNIMSRELEPLEYEPNFLNTTEGYLRFCTLHPLMQIDGAKIKEILIKILSNHFNKYKEGLDYLQKTQALLNFCMKLGFNVVIQGNLDTRTVLYHLIKVNFIHSFMVFSDQCLSTDHPSLLIINSPRLLDENTRALITARLCASRVTTRSSAYIAAGAASSPGPGFFAHPPSTRTENAVVEAPPPKRMP